MHATHMPKPCPGCPFGRDPGSVRGLNEYRLMEILESDGGFTCHKTCYDPDGSEIRGREHECAGWLIYHLVNGSAPQMMRIAGRLGLIDEVGLLRYEHKVICDLSELKEAHDPR